MKAMIGIKGKLVVLLLALGLAVGAGVAGNGAWVGQPPPRVDDKQPPLVQGDPPKKDVPPVALDLHGDPLPAGAVARLGTLRWRHAGLTTFAAFLPDGKTVASASADTTALVWDLASVPRPAPAKAQQPGDLDRCWQALAGTDAGKAFDAICELAAAPKDAEAFLKEQVKPAAPVDLQRIAELLAQLDDEQFKVREQAASELLKIGDGVVPALDKALTQDPPLEARKRIEKLRATLTALRLQGERLRAYRAVEVLERIGTPAARQLLQALADGTPEALLTTSAQSL